MQAPTQKQLQVLEFICKVMRKEGAPPTRQEISEHFGFRSPNSAEEHLRALARKSLIEMTPGASRGIRLLPAARALGLGAPQEGPEHELPIIGRVAAGMPVLAEENYQGSCPVAPSCFRPHADYLLRIHGDSMRDAGILDGDLIAVHSTPQARKGQIVVVRIDDEVTIKRLGPSDGRRVQLQAENPAYAAIDIDLRRQQLAIEGIYVGTLRLG